MNDLRAPHFIVYPCFFSYAVSATLMYSSFFDRFVPSFPVLPIYCFSRLHQLVFIVVVIGKVNMETNMVRVENPGLDIVLRYSYLEVSGCKSSLVWTSLSAGILWPNINNPNQNWSSAKRILSRNFIDSRSPELKLTWLEIESNNIFARPVTRDVSF